MLHLYFGRECIDKEKFIYTQIGKKGGRTLVIVPDQYTLEAEKQAFRFLRTEGLLDVEIISMSRLGSRLLEEHGGANRTFIDKYGRHMILSRIGKKYGEDLQVFRGTIGKPAFLEMTNNFISEMKQYNISTDDLKQLCQSLPADSLLYRKMLDLELIYTRYEEEISGKYTDSEDLIDLYTSKIPHSKMIKESDIWVYGFDSFAPKALQVLGNLMAVCKECHVFLTYDKECLDQELFRLPEIVMRNLESVAETFGIKHEREQVDQAFRREDMPSAIIEIEKQLYGERIFPFSGAEGLTIVEAANIYGEAESAASYVLHLIRDKGLRYRDIVIICNDQKVRGSVVRRVFQEYGLKIFDDKKRSIMSSPIAIFITGLIETIADRYSTSHLFKVLKTGFTAFSAEDIEQLENYGFQYRIRGTMWKDPFVKGQLMYGDKGLEDLNELRQQVMGLFAGVEKIYYEAKTVKDFVESYYDYLVETVRLDQQLMDFMEAQKEEGFLDLAEETGQVWGKVMALFDQIVELAGTEPFNGRDFVEMLQAGLSQMEVGVLPPTSDEMVMGTMQRTRSGQAKAVIVIGANEGLLPANCGEEGLFSLDELDFLTANGNGREICRTDQIRIWEEQLAIYRNLSKAANRLWISYSISDEEGKELKPSEIIDTLKRIFPDLQTEKDVLNRGDHLDLIGGSVNTLRHLVDAVQEGKEGRPIDGEWKLVLDWFRERDRESLERISAGLSFTNRQHDLPQELADLLYKGSLHDELVLSPSRLERFSRCPFAHFVSYGLRPEEKRVFQAAGREIGDLYHQCLMEVSEYLTKEDKWNHVSEEECRTLVGNVIDRQADDYGEGVFRSSREEQYKLRRVEDTCFHVCWALIEQVRNGEILESRYEESFGRNHQISPICVNCGEKQIYIEGKIDRLDIMNEERVKIIDYKTGQESFDVDEAKGGYRLQLMLYLKAAQQKTRKPAGVFYFLIGDPRVDLTQTEKEKVFEKISKEMRKFFRLDGIMVDSDSVIDGIAGEFDGYSDIVPLRKGKEGIKATREQFLLSEEEFSHLQRKVDQQIEKLCKELSSGRIAIEPKKTERTSPCVYCQYHSICRFDTAFEGCNYEVIK